METLRATSLPKPTKNESFTLQKHNNMKNKLYTLITGLLMAACATSYGQEIVSEFTSTSNSLECDIAQAKDGSLIVCSDYGDQDYLVYKLSPDCMVLDSITIPGTDDYEEQFLEIPTMPDHYLAIFWQSRYGQLQIKFILFNADLMVIGETSTSFQTSYQWSHSPTPFLLSPDETILFRYSDLSGETPVSHVVRFTIDGVLLDNIVLAEGLRSAFLSIFTEQPLTYNCLGNRVENDTIHRINYILDNDFNLIDSLEYATVGSGITFTDGLGQLIPFTQPGPASHLMHTSLNSSGRLATSFIKYDIEGNPLAYHIFTEQPQANYRAPITKDQDCIYSSYGFYTQFGVSQHLLRFDDNLNTVWDFPIPCPNSQQNIIRSIKVLRNGDIAVGTTRYNSPNTSILELFIIRDNVPSNITEAPNTSKPYALFPNPVKDRLTLHFDEGHEPESVELYDLAGSLVAKHSKAMESIDMSAMPAGVYMLCVTFKDGERRLEKIIKE